LFTTTLGIYSFREEAHNKYLDGSEDKWGFGQTLPMLLLGLPSFQAFEILVGKFNPRSTTTRIWVLQADNVVSGIRDTTHTNDSDHTHPASSHTVLPPPNRKHIAEATSAALEVKATKALVSADLPSELVEFASTKIVRSLTAFSALRGRRDDSDTRTSHRTGFWRILELRHLEINEVEDLIYGNLLFNGFMLALLLGLFTAATTISWLKTLS
jgi:hypothetical protein